MTSDCECTEEYGPCEQHGIMWVSRDGAASYTADELALLLVDDLLDIARVTGGQFGTNLGAWGMDIVNEARAALAACESFSKWLDDADLSQSLSDVAWQCENGSDLWITHDDGYTIVQCTGGPLFD